MNIKARLKQASFTLFEAGQMFGLFILPVHYYVPLAATRRLRKAKQLWNRPIDVSHLAMDDDSQRLVLREWIKPFEAEYRGNKAYLDATDRGSGPGYGYIEAQALHGFIRKTKPRRIIEIGSGVSTACMLSALRADENNENINSTLTCIEPYPYQWLADAPVTLIRKPVEQVDLSIFDDLNAGDLLFVDSSHAVKPGGDVSKIYLEILPRLKSGVHVHIHDIFIPYAFGRDVDRTYMQWMETALVIAMLAHSARYRVLLCMSYMHYLDQTALQDAFPEYRPQPNDGGLLPAGTGDGMHFPSSIYLRVK